jgi:coenzyme F420-reducing hydrogenase delta subunit
MMLYQIGINPDRLRLEWVDKGETAKLQQIVNRFVDDINKLGPVVY